MSDRRADEFGGVRGYEDDLDEESLADKLRAAGYQELPESVVQTTLSSLVDTDYGPEDMGDLLLCRVIDEQNAEIAALELKNDQLLEALKNAPEPGTGILGAMQYKDTGELIESVHYDAYGEWYDGARREALKDDRT